jgi:hydrogenase maturation protein HypF
VNARRIRVRGVVQGVGFRPFVYRLAQTHAIRGWVLNEEAGVEIHAEASDRNLAAFIAALRGRKPSAASVSSVEVSNADAQSFTEFTIRESRAGQAASVRISPDLPVCARCLAELFDPADRRYLYPYVNCTDCGPRFTIIESLPYDRARTTMRTWALDAYCAAQYHDPLDRRFHAEPVACPECGPHYRLESPAGVIAGDDAGIREAAARLREGGIVAVKGIGGYHLSCDAKIEGAVLRLRQRKFRKEKPFAIMARSLAVARSLVVLSPVEEDLLESQARPIVLARAKFELPGVANGIDELGVMLPYAPLHYLLFEAGAPDALVMTSGNRASEPIAYRDAFPDWPLLSGGAGGRSPAVLMIPLRAWAHSAQSSCEGRAASRRAQLPKYRRRDRFSPWAPISRTQSRW